MSWRDLEIQSHIWAIKLRHLFGDVKADQRVKQEVLHFFKLIKQVNKFGVLYFTLRGN